MSPFEAASNNPPVSERSRVALILISQRDASLEDLEQLLESEHFQHETFADGRQLLARAVEIAPSIVISDILAPHLDGFSLCRLLKNDTRTASVPVLLMSRLAAREQAEQAGADAFLKRPLNGHDLIRAVRVLLNQEPDRAEIAS